jgi:nucleotide-binding universal stress UspA family protein
MDMPGDSIAAEDALAVLDPREHWLTLLHVVPRNASDTRQAEALRRLQERIPEVRRGTIVAQVRRGYVLDEILELTSHTGVDLLVIGARPRASLGRRLFGITRRLLAHEGCPVLAVPAKEVREARAA